MSLTQGRSRLCVRYVAPNPGLRDGTRFGVQKYLNEVNYPKSWMVFRLKSANAVEDR